MIPTLTKNALGRIKAIISDSVRNNAITKTPAGGHLTMDTFGVPTQVEQQVHTVVLQVQVLDQEQ